MYEVAVEQVCAWMKRVDVGDEPERRLRAPRRKHRSNPQAAQWIDALRMEQRLRTLREHVVRVRVSGMRERAVPLGIPRLQPASRRDDARRLRADTGPRVAFALELLFHLAVVGSAFLQRRHVQPFDDENPVEACGVRRPPDDHADLVVGHLRGLDVPHAIDAERAVLLVRVRGADRIEFEADELWIDGGYLLADLRGRAADGRHGDHHTEHCGDDAEPGKRVPDLGERRTADRECPR